MADSVREKDEASTRRRAGLLNIRYFDSRKIHQYPLFRELLSNEELYRYKSVILSHDKGEMVIAITINTPQNARKELSDRFKDARVQFVMISESGFKEFMKFYDPPKEVVYEDIAIEAEDNPSQVEGISKTLEEVKGEDMFGYLLEQSQKLRASDIHLENTKEGVRIRFRIDAVLHDIANLSQEKFRQLVSSISVHADLAVAAPDPQTGHMQILVNNKELNMRVETVPTIYGQDMVIRIFTLDRDLLKLENLGLNEASKNIINEIVSHPSGLVLTVGPTGSGKTTTLYSIINALNTSDKKIITLEDPVEYTLPGLIQVPVISKGNDHSFADHLRSVLRLDPDIIMIGEIRDVDTAKTALQAALSGHLVLSTFHANDSAAALSRLVDMVGDNPLLPSAIRAVFAQRLVRVLDQDIRKAYKPVDGIKDKILEQFPDDEEIKNRVRNENFELFNPGKSDSSPFGYTGQTILMELLTMNHEITQLLTSGGVPSRDDIYDAAIKSGMETLLQSGLQKVINGATSLDEIYRVVG